jgi:hypothetical protein
MRPTTDPLLLALFGSETRTAVLAVLAGAHAPLTGYRVAKVAGVERIRAYEELRRLRDVGAISEATDAAGNSIWSLPRSDLRTMVGNRLRISWDEDWDRAREGWEAETPVRLAAIRASLPTDPAFFRPKGWKPTAYTRRRLREVVRTPEKDRLLRRVGARTSYREGKKL